jgi:MFS family permease
VIRKLFTWNARSFPETCVGLTAYKVEERGQFSGLFRHGLAKLTVLLGTVALANYYVFLAFAAYLPLVLEKAASNESQPLKQNKCDDNLDQSGLIGIMIAFSGDSLGAFVAAIIGGMYGDHGHRLVFRGLAFVALFATIPVFFDLTKLITKIISMLLRFSICGLGYSFWLFSTIDYPTVLRGTASSFQYAIGNSGSILGSLLTYALFPVSPVAVVALLVGIAVMQVVASLLLKANYQKDLADHTNDS